MTRRTNVAGIVRSKITRGRVVTARWLNQGVEIDNALLASIRSPEQLRAPAQPLNATEKGAEEEDKQGEEGDAIDEAPAPNISAIVWDEIARVTETVRVFQDGDTTSANYVDIVRPVTIDFLSHNAAGDITINRFRLNN